MDGVVWHGQGVLAIEGGVDITDPESLNRPELWQGVSQVACAVGPVFGKLPDGKMGCVQRLRSCKLPREV